jgi:hypothetical protein
VTGKLGVHGESLGGSVAAYIASRVKLDFVLVNRTFSCLQSVAHFGGGKAVVWLFKFLTCGGWPDKGLEHFQSILPETYTLFGADPNDTIIPNMASLKTAIARD